MGKCFVLKAAILLQVVVVVTQAMDIEPSQWPRVNSMDCDDIKMVPLEDLKSGKPTTACGRIVHPEMEYDWRKLFESELANKTDTEKTVLFNESWIEHLKFITSKTPSERFSLARECLCNLVPRRDLWRSMRMNVTDQHDDPRFDDLLDMTNQIISPTGNMNITNTPIEFDRYERLKIEGNFEKPWLYLKRHDLGTFGRRAFGCSDLKAAFKMFKHSLAAVSYKLLKGPLPQLFNGAEFDDNLFKIIMVTRTCDEIFPPDPY